MSDNPVIISRDPKRHKQYTKEERYNFCTKWKESGLSMTQFCKEAGISVSTLSTWVSIYCKNKRDLFKPLNIPNLSAKPSCAAPDHSIEITLTTGVNIKIIRPPIAALITLVKELIPCN